MWLLYQLATALLLVIGAPYFLATRGKHYLETLPGRLGRYRGSVPERPLWIHAVSVGEVGVAATLIEHLPEDLPLVVTTVTPTGQKRAQATLGERAAVAYLPFDLGLPVRRFLRRFRPRALVLTEGDYWPLLLARLKRSGVPTAVVNGRVSDRGLRRMSGLRSLLPMTLGRIDSFSVQTEADRERLEALGVEAGRIAVTGNLKYEVREPERIGELESALATCAGDRPILLAGSTMNGEESAVIDAFEALGGGRRALLLLAPRHPERWDEVERLLRDRGLGIVRRSRLDESSEERLDAVLLDSLGELAGLYRIATAAFVGGTLTGTGGHNPLEPARFGVPVAVGPSMENFRQIAREFDRDRAWARVGDGPDLGESWARWLDDPERARRVGQRGEALVASNRGAAERTVRELEPILELFGDRS